MSVIRKILGGKSGSDDSILEPADRLVLVDGPSVFGPRQDHLSPRDQMSALHRLVTIAKEEGWEILVMFEGEELRKAPADELFEELITVRYAGHAEDFLDQMCDEITNGKKRKNIVLVTSDLDMIERAEAIGCPMLTSATFRKAFDRTINKRKGQNDRRGRGGRNRNKGKKKENVTPRDAVSELIDLVD